MAHFAPIPAHELPLCQELERSSAPEQRVVPGPHRAPFKMLSWRQSDAAQTHVTPIS